ncbi:hypothetical protein Tco_1002120 [Tanacetum coccineum]|uniref:Uncharacterized protein n=1 Tax=Tanacetum coccineum TaxID=301880 RepID=A0ABQ5F783_9ASTR
MVDELNNPGKEVIFQTSGAQVDLAHDIDEEVVEKEENIDDEEEQEEGLAEEEDENDFERDANELPH